MVNDKNEILVIKQDARQLYWEFPGGSTEPLEDIKTAVEREVEEETGIKAEYRRIFSFRHLTGWRHGCSDFHIVCLMRAKTTEIKACPVEVEVAKWISVSIFSSSLSYL